ncbi:DUF952 domain-containing protein [Parvularcula marina]|uniref:DUF952 domain-containing protein n=1 Tax=Parvularcula marina TaxID=2292771 RepID=UPI0035199B05
MSPFREGYLYRLCCPAQWDGLRKCEHVPYSPDDAHDGFFHMSTPAQLLETAAKHYAIHPKLVAIGCPDSAPGELLKWEPSRGGALFPHVYGDVLTEWFDHLVPLIKQADGYVPVPGAEENI